MRLYHFTSTAHLPVILREGRLRVTESNLSMLIPHVGPDVVWFVDTPELGDYDHGLSGSIVDKREVRFTVDVPDTWVRHYLTWAMHSPDADTATLAAMISTAGGHEAAEHWYVTFRSVWRNRWARVENVYTGQTYWERRSV